MKMELFNVFANLILCALALKIILYFWYILRTYFLTRIGFTKSLKEYGEWAVVTGATDGIGKEYAKQLAQRGLNICLISRSKEKLETTAEEIKRLADVKTKSIEFDFSKQDCYEKIRKELKHLDIGILVNNVGVWNHGNFEVFESISIDDIVKNLNINLVSNIQMTQMVLPGFKSKKKGIIVHMSSLLSKTVLSFCGIYPATKVSLEQMVRMLQIEAHGLVDHQIVIACLISTNMSRQKPSFTVPTSKEYVTSAIRTIGVADVTCGYLLHELAYLRFILIPSAILNYFFERTILKNRQKNLE